MSSLEATERASAAHATHPRVSLHDIESAIANVYYCNGWDVARIDAETTPANELKTITICLLEMDNGFTVIGKAAPASPQNFDADLGRQFAYEDAVRQLWPLMGFALRDKLANT